jgi:hypothetical protein
MTPPRMLSFGLAFGMILLQPGVQTGHAAWDAQLPPAGQPKLAPLLPTGLDSWVWSLALSEDGQRLTGAAIRSGAPSFCKPDAQFIPYVLPAVQSAFK